MRRWILGVLFLGLLLWPAASAAQGRVVLLARVAGAIDPSTARYVLSAIQSAEAIGAQALVLELDTPGGLDTSMRDIVQAMRRSPIPIVVYVGPPGARAASAGVFISYAADVLAMAPATNIGAAHPVTMGGGDIPSTEADKVVADSVAYLRALAETTPRNADWGAKAVQQSVSATAQEALQLKVADLLATDLPDLLRQLNGRVIHKGERSLTLDTAGVAVQELSMSWPERIVHVLIDPSVTYLLLAVAVWALITEFSAPGISIPGVIGLACLVLFAVSASIIPINWAGVILILASVVFFVADIKAPAHGVLTAGGITTFVLGSLLLYRPAGVVPPLAMPQPQVWRVPVLLIVAVGGSTALIFVGALTMGLRAQRLAPVMSQALLVGATGEVTSTRGNVLTVQVRSELRSARPAAGDASLVVGDLVRVVAVDGLTLIVHREQSE
jgi:membrane-bound serine protease (ClpP class)